MCVSVFERERVCANAYSVYARVCVCVWCVFVREIVCVCVCVCGVYLRERVYVCVLFCVYLRERERDCVCVCECDYPTS